MIDMISLLPLQHFMSLTLSTKNYAFAPCSVFYVYSFHVAWVLHQVLPKLLSSLVCIKLMVALALTILWLALD
ncbi:hypothetical protein BHE74_00054431 [Ensete ventricosum]|nr:hypothetical protein GW17_00052043 [Ensete ventricosum]RWW40179.1 hypothetical protein BHE74_00054431 [Ensete ventricosum]RZS25435.1 hypothetical protein BHM03_00058629 [Ensete ventricosum]